MSTDGRETSREERENIRLLMQHPGWTALMNKVIRRRAENVKRRMITHKYSQIGEVWADQAFVQCLEGIPAMIESTLAEDEQAAKRRALQAQADARRSGGGASY